MYKTTRILLIFLSLSLIFGQTAEELKRFMDTYDKIKVDQQANDIVKKGIDSEKDPDDGPVRLIIEPGDMTKYYREKMNVIKKDLDQLNKLTDIFRVLFNRPDLELGDNLTAKDIPGWDSFNHVNLIINIEEEFSVRFSNDEVGGMQNVGHLKTLLASKLP